jgi:hypothetical protein
LVAIDNAVNPREYLGKFWVDSLVHDEKVLQYVVETMGEDKVILGSDYPFPCACGVIFLHPVSFFSISVSVLWNRVKIWNANASISTSGRGSPWRIGGKE